MSDPDSPQFPQLPDIGEILDRKSRFIPKKITIVKCRECKAKYSREFKAGDFVFKKVDSEDCKECHRSKALTIEEIYSEWIDPKKNK